jgi:hypothetical protein
VAASREMRELGFLVCVGDNEESDDAELPASGGGDEPERGARASERPFRPVAITHPREARRAV